MIDRRNAIVCAVILLGCLLGFSCAYHEKSSAGSPPFDRYPICDCTVPWAKVPCWQVDDWSTPERRGQPVWVRYWLGPDGFHEWQTNGVETIYPRRGARE